MPLARFARSLVTLLLLLPAFAAAGPPQQSPLSPPRTSNPFPDSAKPTDPDPGVHTIEQRQVKARNDERQKRLIADTEKLLALATQLHEDVGKTDKNILSLDVIKRSDEIEKLAHNIKERMKG